MLMPVPTLGRPNEWIITPAPKKQNQNQTSVPRLPYTPPRMKTTTPALPKSHRTPPLSRSRNSRTARPDMWVTDWDDGDVMRVVVACIITVQVGDAGSAVVEDAEERKGMGGDIQSGVACWWDGEGCPGRLRVVGKFFFCRPLTIPCFAFILFFVLALVHMLTDNFFCSFLLQDNTNRSLEAQWFYVP